MGVFCHNSCQLALHRSLFFRARRMSEALAGNGQSNNESAAALIGMHETNLPAMRFRNPSRDGETETGATARAGFGALPSFVRAIETLEDVWLQFDRNAGASVGYSNDVVGAGP